MNFKIKNYILSLAFIAPLLFNCTTTEIPIVEPIQEKITYNKHIKVLVNNGCATSSCHDAVNPAAGLKLTNYTEVKASAENGSFHARINNGSMPPSGPLPPGPKSIIDKWKSDGYLEN